MKIIAIGDSITGGFPYTQKQSWVACIAKELPCDVVNKGINGELTLNIAERFERDVLTYKPSHVIILGGTNDAYQKYPLDSVVPNFTAMVKMSLDQGILPILGLPAPSLALDDELFLKQYRDWLIDYAKLKNLLILDFYSPFLKYIEAGEEAKYFLDEVHPNLDGYKLMGETAVDFFKSLEK